MAKAKKGVVTRVAEVLGFSQMQIAAITPDNRRGLTTIVEEPAISADELFRPYQPAPGVIPKGETQTVLAMDDAFPYGGPSAAGFGLNWGQGVGFLGYAFLAELTQRPEYRRAGEIIAKEMTRKWIKFKSTGTADADKSKKILKLEDACRRHRLRDIIREATQMDGFFGLAHIYIDTGDTDEVETLKLPLIIDKRTIKKGDLKGFRVIDPIWTAPNNYNASDPLHPAYYRPQSWFVNGKLLNSSRLITLISRPVPDILKPAYNFGGISLSQLGMPYVNNWLRTRQSVSDITHAFSVPVLKTQLGDILQLGAMAQFITRATAFNRFRDNRGLFIVDKDKEDFQIAAAPLSSLDKLQAQAQEQMASVWGIPLVVLLGITPSGLNASTDGEIRTFYSWIHAQQEQLYNDPLKRMIDIIQLDEFGEIDPEITFEYVSLWELDEAAKAVVRKTNADTHAIYIADSVVSNEEVRTALATDPDSLYSSLDLGDTPPPEPDPDDETGIEVNPKISGDPAKSEIGKSGV